MKQLRIRRWVLVGLVVVVVVIFVARLMEMQIVNAEQYKNIIDGSYVSTQVVKATRGEIVDRNGNPVTVNRLGHDIVIDKAYLPKGTAQNEILLRLMNLCDGLGEAWTDNLPVSRYQPFHFLPEHDAQIEKLKEFLGVQSYATVEDVMYRLIERYGLEEFEPLDQRKIAAVRYEMEQRGFAYNVLYTFATDISINSVIRIKEHSYELAGVDISESAIRQYADGTLAPHIIGTVGPIYQEEWESQALKALGYAMDDIIGKEGVEKAFESVLRGQNGRREIHLETGNIVLKAVETQPPVPGNTVVLSIDAGLQRALQEALERQIKYLQENEKEGEGKEADAGAAVLLDVKTGEVLAIATYPSYDLATYRQDFSSLIADTVGTPLLNRALQGEYAPGSTFKPTVALTGLNADVISSASTVLCQQVYPSGTHSFTCLGYHGSINVGRALCRSCNIFFYDTGKRAGIDAVDAMAAMLGLGEPTGIEIAEKTGQRSNPAVKMEVLGEQWYEGDVLQSSIGQLFQQYTPLQLANYAATIANRGNRMKVTIVHEIRDYSLQKVVDPFEPEVALKMDVAPEHFETVIDGMVQASRPGGTASATFGWYPIDVASKTGTPETAQLPNSTFIAFAPAQDPQVAVAVVIEKGWHGYTGAPVARDIFNAYFGFDNSAPTPQVETSAGPAPQTNTASPGETDDDPSENPVSGQDDDEQRWNNDAIQLPEREDVSNSNE